MGICNRTLIDCAQMFGRPLLHSRYQLRGYHASFGTSTNRYKFSSADGNMSSVNVVVDNNEAEALSLLAKRRRKADVIFGLYESPITGQNSIHTRRAPNEALQYETLPCPVKIGISPTESYFRAQIEKWICFPKRSSCYHKVQL